MREELISLFESTRVPRYTSYPTAPHFSPATGARDYSRWLGDVSADEPLSVYVHVPFCRQLCWYCGCNTKVTNRQAPVDRYLDDLCRELALVAGAMSARPPLKHLHFGGGTPSTLGPAGFSSFMDRLAGLFPFADDAELAIEVDPRFLDDEMIRSLADGGINRASFGIQSFDPAVQLAINRVQDFDLVSDRVAALRAHGIDNLSFDLLYGLPHQTVEACNDTLDKALILAPDRFAVFAYAHLPQRIRHQRLISDAALPGAIERVDQYERMRERLVAAGYQAVGIDHFAKPEDPMAEALRRGTLRRNFQGYTTDACNQLIGLGASAIGSLPGGYVQNHVDAKAYRAAIDQGVLPVARGLALSPSDLAQRDIIERLMCFGSVDLAEIARNHNRDIEELVPDPTRFASLEKVGLAARAGSRISITGDAQPFLRLLAACFDRYLQPATDRHASAF